MDHKPKYYTSLRNVTDKNDWKDWILYVLDGVEQTALYTQNKIDAIIDLRNKTEQEVKAKLPDMYSKELVEVIFRQPYCKRKFLEDAQLVKKKTAGVYLNELERIGVFKSKKVGKEKLYFNKKLFDILKK
jgi:Fic family protein